MGNVLEHLTYLKLRHIPSCKSFIVKMSSTWDEVKEIMDSVQEKHKDELDMAKIEPFSEECKFGKNGIWLFIGKQGSGKTHKLIQTILYAEHFQEKPFFTQIIFSSTSEGLDKTLETYKKKIKTPIEFVPEPKLFERLQAHLKRKTKFYSMMKWVNSNGSVSDKNIEHMAEKHRLYDKSRTAKYIRKKIADYGHPAYPANLLLILDDYLGSDLLEAKNSQVVKFLTKCRHFNITCVISQQSTKGIGRTVRRLASDAVIWKGFGEDDFIDLVREFSISMDKKELYKIYSNFKDTHDCMSIHNHLDEVEVELH